MPTDIQPQADHWYLQRGAAQPFLVTAIDEQSGEVEMQLFDGALESIALDDWYQLDIEPAEPPEDWSGPLDVGDVEDLTADVTDPAATDWQAPDETETPTILGEKTPAGEK